MTEEEWLACDDPDRMFEFLEDGASNRKSRLFTSACCRHIWSHLSASCSRRVIELIELIADDALPASDLEIVVQEAVAYAQSPEGQSSESGCSAAFTAAYAVAHYSSERLIWVASRTAEQARNTVYWAAQESREANGDLIVTKGEAEGNAASRAAGVAQTILLPDIFGNPFRPVTLLPEWRTSTVLSLAQGIYSDRAFDRMPILADALQDSGCDNEELLNHCRGPGPHVRGCFVIDLLTNRE
jgi:hypothetical protein